MLRAAQGGVRSANNARMPSVPFHRLSNLARWQTIGLRFAVNAWRLDWQLHILAITCRQAL